MSHSIKVISRALTILHTLALKDEPFSLAEITEQTGLPKSTVHYILQGLESENAAKKVRPGYYTIGKSLISLGAKVVRGGIVFRAAPIMRKLRDKTGYTVYLSSVNKYELVYLHRVPGEVMPA
ncbi:MAG: helix-turn-helix domain-containing protein, partial [bacterium]